LKKIRLIARMDIKSDYLVKGIQLEGIRKIGNPNEYAKKYYQQGIDEIIYMDVVASLYGRNSLKDIIYRSTEEVFIPMTVGGGIRSIEDVKEILRAGADKVAINTAAIKNPKLISDVSLRFGSQCMVLSIEAKKVGLDKWDAYYDNGREPTGIDVINWAKKGYELGAGEILLTSVDKDGTKSGFDCELVKEVSAAVPIPVIASGGMGTIEHLYEVVNRGNADAVAMGTILHYNLENIKDIRTKVLKRGIEVRRLNDE
jgi:cyclase